jgi:predicted lysophospholipase L1 biosynthesis ABC-type transport system permease subunit
LRSIGLSPGQLYGTLVLEQVILILAGLAIGTLLGVVLNQITLPGLPITFGERPPTPPFQAQNDWGGVLRIYLILAGAFLISLGVATTLLWRTGSIASCAWAKSRRSRTDVKFALRHMLRHWRMNLVVLGGLIVSIAFLAGLPSYATAIAGRGLQQQIDAAPVSARNISINSSGLNAAVYGDLQALLGDFFVERMTLELGREIGGQSTIFRGAAEIAFR